MKNERHMLDLLNTNGMLLSTEDKIMATLYREKAASKSELLRYLFDKGLLFPEISKNINNMENKGFVVLRNYDGIESYYLTYEGVYELVYRFMQDVFFDLHSSLEKRGFPAYNVRSFFKNRFYNFYIAGEWNLDTIEEQYFAWCDSNNLEYNKPFRKVLKK